MSGINVKNVIARYYMVYINVDFFNWIFVTGKVVRKEGLGQYLRWLWGTDIWIGRHFPVFKIMVLLFVFGLVGWLR